jgi:hypothetical protein
VTDARVSPSIPQPQGLDEDPLSQYTRIFIRFLQLIFESFPKGSYHWDLDDLLSDIVLQGEGTISNEVVEKRPAVVVSRGPVSFTNISIDQLSGPLWDQKLGRFVNNLDPTTGARRHTDLLSSVMTYSCVAREGLEAQRIAWLSAYVTRSFKRALMKAGIHRVGEDLAVGPESPPGSIVSGDTKEATMVQVSVPFLFQQTWTVAPVDKLLLTRVSMALRSEAGYPDEEPPALRGPGMNGQPLNAVKRTSLNQVVESNRAVAPTPKK